MVHPKYMGIASPTGTQSTRNFYNSINGHTSYFDTRSTGTIDFQTFQLILQEVANPIQLFRNTKELVQAFRDALEAHRLIHENAQILHRNITAGNIMITEKGRGILIDWDLSRHMFSNVQAVSSVERMGTWQFMSARLIMSRNPRIPVPIHNREDDLESFWHVLLWTALRRCEHRMQMEETVSELYRLFDYFYIETTGEAKGGNDKRTSLMAVRTGVDMKLCSEPLQHILSATANVLASRYIFDERLEENVRKVEEIWDTVRMKNPDLQEEDLRLEGALHHEIFNKDDPRAFKDPFDGQVFSALIIWSDRRSLAGPQWMEAIFQAALDDPEANWDIGGANIERFAS